MNSLTEEIFVQIKARRSLVAIATKASTQRGAGHKAPVKMLMNLGYSVFKVPVFRDRVDRPSMRKVGARPHYVPCGVFPNGESALWKSSTTSSGTNPHRVEQ